MGAAETIQAAIDKLESLKSSTTRGPWIAAAGLDDEKGLSYSIIAEDFEGAFDVLDAVTDESTPRHRASANVDLVETLHRTIDAQLMILRDGLRFEEAAHGGASLYVTLARAILGAD